eukprot:CCRYP_018516-RA/>CCRYP_018516-RA protein AED:0.46 eAED:0.42 QI:0/0/0/1/0/0/3/0/180
MLRFLLHTNPGLYPANVDPNPGVCERQAAGHKKECKMSNPGPIEILAHHDLGGPTIDYMDVTDLMAQLMVPWETTKILQQNNRIEQQLTSFGLPDQANIRLALALSTFKGTAKYDDTICKWEVKAVVDKLLANFCPCIIDKYIKKSKTNWLTAKSVCLGIANAVTKKATLEHEEHPTETA